MIRAKYSRPIQVIAWLAVVLAGAGCKNTFDPGTQVELNVQIQGNVTAEDTGLAIEGAVIEVRTTTASQLFAETVTDAAGDYSLSFLYRYFLADLTVSQFCPFELIADAPGFLAGFSFIQCVEDTTTIDLVLSPS